MDLTKWMNHTCSVERITAYVEDPLGNETIEEKTPVYLGMCRLIEKQETLAPIGAGAAVTRITTYQLILPLGTDIQERDLIASVVFEDETILVNRFTVESLIRRRFLRGEHHIVAILKKVT